MNDRLRVSFVVTLGEFLVCPGAVAVALTRQSFGRQRASPGRGSPPDHPPVRPAHLAGCSGGADDGFLLRRREAPLQPGEARFDDPRLETYLELGSVHALERWLMARGFCTKQRTTRSGATVGGGPFNRGALFYMLRNRTYLGMVVHRDKVYPGMHPAIVDADLFAAVQTQLDANARRYAERSATRVARAPLTGRIFDADGRPMSPSFTYGRRKHYRYYVSAPLQRGERRRGDDGVIRRVPGPALEAKLAEIIRRLAPSNAPDPLALLTRVAIHPDHVHLLMSVEHLAAMRGRLVDREHVEQHPADASLLRLTLPLRMQLRGLRAWTLGGAEPTARPDPVLIRALRGAHAMLERDASGRPVLETIPSSPYHRRMVRLAFLAPDLQRAMLAGRQAEGLTLKQLIEGHLPLLWSKQAQVFGLRAPG